jgi:low affinity Fe/Cu permease
VTDPRPDLADHHEGRHEGRREGRPDERGDGHPDEHADKPPVSTLVHRVGALVGHELGVPLVLVTVLVWLLAWVVAGEPDWLLHAFEIAAASVTVVMVFVLQHAQHRLERATQLKLDELLRTHPGADDALIKAEVGPDHEISSRAEQNLHYRHELRNGET